MHLIESRIAASCMFAFALAGCGRGVVQDLARLDADPVAAAPSVRSFEIEDAVAVDWPADPAAESYVLERALDADLPAYETVYDGTDTSFSDSDGASQERYLYRLSARRGGKIFGPSASTLGVFGSVREDGYEPNDQEDSATPLVCDRDSNIYFYRAGNGSTVEDVDWYSVDLPARSRVSIVVSQTTGISQGDLDTILDWYLPGSASVSAIVNDSSSREIVNYEFSPRTVRVRITVNPARCMTSYTLTGGTMVNYVIKAIETRSL